MIEKLEDKLGWIAFHFRGTRDLEKRKEYANQYAAVVIELVESGLWAEIPAFEDQLPDEYMPEAFFKYWGLRWPR